MGADRAGDQGQPLGGRTVVVTRPEEQAEALAAALRELGARVHVAPTIRIEEVPDVPGLDEAVREIERYDWLVFTSRNAVRSFLAALRRSGRAASTLGECRVCVVGPATADAFRKAGGRVHRIADEHRAEGVVSALAADGEIDGRRILYPHAEGARAVVGEALREGGAEVTELVLYRAVADEAGVEQLRRLLESKQIDYLTFLSSSAVESFVAAFGTDTGGAMVAAIGPVTASTARRLGLEVAVEAEPYTVQGLTDRLTAHASGAGRGAS